MRKLLLGLAASTALIALGGAAHASALTGEIWVNDPTSGNASIVPAGTADATFDPGVINYQSDGSYTINEFLHSPTFNNQSAAFVANGGGGATANNIFLRITGTLGLLSGANSFVVGHDDGAVLTVDGFGTVVNAPGPTSFSNSPFIINNPGPAENVGFTLLYSECCGAPADLLFTVNNVSPGGVPEPATWAMMLVGFGGLGAMLRRRRSVALAA
jgi:hypothetical protein